MARAECAATWATRLADGELLAHQQAELQAWLDENSAHGQAIEEIVGTWDAVEAYAASQAVMAMRQAALASARRSLSRNPIANHAPIRRFGLVAATFAVVVAGAGIWEVMPRSYETGIGERRIVALADGSKISMDASTSLKVRYTQVDRRLWLERGRAKFDVAKNPLRPFSVEAAGEVVVATGTAFTVEMLQNRVHVVLYEGHVALLERNNSGTRPTVVNAATRLPIDRLLTPGREVIVSQAPTSQSDQKVALIELADPVRSLSWEAGQLVFDDEKLGAVVERMNRYAEKPLRVGNAAAADLRISGVFRAGDTNALVQGLAAAFDIQAHQETDAVVLSKR